MARRIRTTKKFRKRTAVVWCRVSSKEQQEEGFTLDKQLREGTEYAEQIGVTIARSFEVPESASKTKGRSVFKEMMKYLGTSRTKVLICERVDRITRNLQDSVTAYEWLEADEEREIHFIRERLVIHKNSKSDAKFRWDILVILAKKYSDDLSENIQGGLFEKAQQGWWPGTRKYGYQSLRIEGDKRARWYLDTSPSSHAPFIKQFFELFAHTDYSAVTCRDMLFKEGWQRHGKPIPTSRVYEILKDIFYTGKFRYKGKLYQGKHEPLISLDVFEACQRRLNANASTKYRKHIYALRGPWFTCGVCGRRITAERQRRIVYYHHSAYRNCEQQGRRWVREDVLESEVIDALGVFEVFKEGRVFEAVHGAIREREGSQHDYHSRALSGLQEQQKRYQDRLDNLYEDYLDGEISKPFYRRKRDQYEQEHEKATLSIERHQNATGNIFEQAETLLILASRVKDIYKRRSPEEKQTILRLVFSNMTLKDETLSYTYSKPFQVLALCDEIPEWWKIAEDLCALDWLEFAGRLKEAQRLMGPNLDKEIRHNFRRGR